MSSFFVLDSTYGAKSVSWNGRVDGPTAERVVQKRKVTRRKCQSRALAPRAVKRMSFKPDGRLLLNTTALSSRTVFSSDLANYYENSPGERKFYSSTGPTSKLMQSLHIDLLRYRTRASSNRQLRFLRQIDDRVRVGLFISCVSKRPRKALSSISRVAIT